MLIKPISQDKPQITEPICGGATETPTFRCY